MYKGTKTTPYVLKMMRNNPSCCALATGGCYVRELEQTFKTHTGRPVAVYQCGWGVVVTRPLKSRSDFKMLLRAIKRNWKA